MVKSVYPASLYRAAVRPSALRPVGDGDRRAEHTSLACRLLICGLLLVTPPSHAAKGSQHASWTRSGDLLQWAIPLAGLGLGFLLDDHDRPAGTSPSGATPSDAAGLNWPGPRLARSPQHDFLVSFVRMEITTQALKYSLNTQRPNGGRRSFPSGHAASTFMGAEFIRKELARNNYSKWWGAPAYAAAGWVGYTRVQARQHYWGDVVGGALIGIAANHDFGGINTPIGRLHIAPALLTTTLNADFGGEDDDVSHPVPGVRLEVRF